MTNGAYRLPATVCAFGLPKYTPTDGPPCSRITSPRRSATTAYASSQVASVSTPPRRTRGWVNRSGSLSSSPKLAPLGQMKPPLKTSSRSPQAPHTHTPAEDIFAVTAGAGHPTLGDRERQAAGGLAKGTDPQGSPGVSHARIFLRLPRRVNADGQSCPAKSLRRH